MNVEPILIMALSVLTFAVAALGIATVFGVAIVQVQNLFRRNSTS